MCTVMNIVNCICVCVLLYGCLNTGFCQVMYVLFEWYLLWKQTYSILYSCRTEANDLALRLARTYTKHNDVIVLDRLVPFRSKKSGCWKT